VSRDVIAEYIYSAPRHMCVMCLGAPSLTTDGPLLELVSACKTLLWLFLPRGGTCSGEFRVCRVCRVAGPKHFGDTGHIGHSSTRDARIWWGPRISSHSQTPCSSHGHPYLNRFHETPRSQSAAGCAEHSWQTLSGDLLH